MVSYPTRHIFSNINETSRRLATIATPDMGHGVLWEPVRCQRKGPLALTCACRRHGLLHGRHPIVSMSLLSSPTGNRTNLSTVPGEPDGGERVVPLFPAAADSHGRQGFV